MDGLLTTDEVAPLLSVNAQRVRRLVKDGRLAPARRVRGAYLFTPEEVERFKAEPRRPGRPRTKEEAPKRPRGRPRKSAPDSAPPEGERPS